MSKKLKIITINISRYKELTNSLYSFDESIKFDKECGISYAYRPAEGSKSFYFKIVDEQRYFLAKIKYGI